MNDLLFSITIGVVISLAYNYFIFFRSEKIILPLLADIIITSVITFFTITVLSRFEQNLVALTILSLSFFFAYIFYLNWVRIFIYIHFMSKIRNHKIERILRKTNNQEVKVFINKEHNKITVLPNKKQVIIGLKVLENMKEDDISNVICLNLKKNSLYEFFFIIVFFIPAIIFYYAIAYTSGSIETILILSASVLIAVIERGFSKTNTNYSIKSLKNKVNKDMFINSIKRYYNLLSEDLSKPQLAINNYRMNKSIEAINKYL